MKCDNWKRRAGEICRRNVWKRSVEEICGRGGGFEKEVVLKINF